MFRKSKPKLSPPAPPTIEQILEDLETFQVEKPEIEKIRTYNHQPLSANSSQSGSTSGDTNDEAVSEWWKTFETFQSDIHDLHKLRRNFKLAKNEMIEASDSIISKSNEIKKEISEALSNVHANS